MNTKVKTIALILLVAVLAAGFFYVGYALYTMYSNTVEGPVAEQETLTLTVNGSAVNGTTLIQGTQVTLVAATSDSSDTTVSFFNNDALIGNVATSSGSATLLYTIPVSTSYSFTAEADHA